MAAAAVLDGSLLVLLGLVTLSDLRTRLIPDGVLLGGLAVGLLVLALSDPGALPGRLLAGAASAGCLTAAWLIRPEGIGLGDAKLVGVLGVYLGGAVIWALAVAFAAGSIAGLALVARHGWAARRRTIPFAPFLALGAAVAAAAAAF